MKYNISISLSLIATTSILSGGEWLRLQAVGNRSTLPAKYFC